MCYIHYGSPLLRLALRDLKSLYTPIMAITYDHYSNCVVAYHLNSPDLDECLNCLRSKFSTPVRAVALSSLFTIQSAQAANLGNCIRGYDGTLNWDFYSVRRAPESHWYYLSFIQHPSLRFGELVSVVLAYYKTQQCLECYALMHNIVFESTENK